MFMKRMMYGRREFACNQEEVALSLKSYSRHRRQVTSEESALLQSCYSLPKTRSGLISGAQHNGKVALS